VDERPETGLDWMRLVDRRIQRQERRLRSPNRPPVGAVYLVREGDFTPVWEPVPDLSAPSGWVYVQRAQVEEES
jgi:hypothetical protein